MKCSESAVDLLFGKYFRVLTDTSESFACVVFLFLIIIINFL